MAGLEREVEWLRPLVNDQKWDYCVIWKLGDDPSRFIEWGACCCSGGIRAQGITTIKDENGVIGECRDRLVPHPITAKACNKLSCLPTLIPLYSGIHGDVVITQRPQWIIQSNPSVPDDENGTLVLVPLSWGLIELFTYKEVPRDQNIIDYISAHFNLSYKQENMTENWHTNFIQGEQPSDPHSFFHIAKLLPAINNLNFLPRIVKPNSYSSFEGSSTCSSLSNEHQLLTIGSHHVLTDLSPENSCKTYVVPSSSNLGLKRKKPTDSSLTHSNQRVGSNIRQKAAEKGPYKSKNLITERKRRKRIKDGMLVLRALVPKITKMDKLATLGDAADYIKELLQTIDNCRHELQSMEEEDCNKFKAKQDPTLLIEACASEKTPIVVEVEVNQLGKKDFLLRLLCNQTLGGFSRLMEAIDSLGLKVTDVNVTTLNGLVLNVFKVEANTMELQANTLKHALVELIN